MSVALVDLYLRALETAALLALPTLGIIALVGVIVGLAQSLVGIQDQNLSFGPKIAAIALLAAVFGLYALGLLSSLLQGAFATLPYLSR